MKFTKKHPAIATAALSGFILLSATCGQAQERDDGGFKLRTPFRYRPFSSGMTAIDPPSTDIKPRENQPSTDQPGPTPKQPQRSLLGYEKTSNGTLLRYSDGSTVELRPECSIETLCDGTKIEKLPEGTTIVRWPNGGGVIRYPDGTGAGFHPDPQEPSRSSDLSNLDGTVEVLPGGVVRQTLKDGKTAFDKYPDGTIRSSADFGKPETKLTKPMTEPVGKDISKLPLNPFSKKFEGESKKSDSPKSLIPFVKPSIKSGTGWE